MVCIELYLYKCLVYTLYTDNFSEDVQQSQTQLVTNQPQVDVRPQAIKDMNNEQLALWLNNHPHLVGTDYQSDIDKLKGEANHSMCYMQCSYMIITSSYCRCQN